MDITKLSDADLDRMIAEQEAAQAAQAKPPLPVAPAPAVAAPASAASLSDAELDRQFAAANAGTPVGMAEDVARSGWSGLAKGVAGLPGIPADLGSLAQAGVDHAQAYFSGKPVEEVRKNKDYLISPQTLDKWGSQAFTKSAEPYVPGMDYKPQTTVGRYAQTVGEFAPNAVVGGPAGIGRKAVANALLPALASEAAGQATEGTKYEPWARAGAAIVGSPLASKIVTPNPVSAERAAHVAVLDAENIPLTAGQRTGSATLQRAESELGGQAYGRAKDAQNRAYTGAAMARAGEAGELAVPEIMDRAFTRLGRQFDDLSARSSTPLDAQLQNDLLRVVTDYQSVARAPAAGIEQTMNRISELANKNGGILSGEAYQSIRSDLGRHMKAADPETKNALRGIESSLDDAVGRSISPADQARWTEARNQYRNLVTLESASTKAGQVAADGFVTPQNLRQATVTEQGRRNYARGDGDFADLARAGVSVMTDPPNSGTAARLGVSGLTRAPSIAAGTFIGNQLGSPVMGAMIGGAVPEIVGGAIMSRPGQAYLGNQLAAGLSREANQAALVNALMQGGPIAKGR